MPQSKKQRAVKEKNFKGRIAEIEQELKLPIIDKTKKANLEYELSRLKKRL